MADREDDIRNTTQELDTALRKIRDVDAGKMTAGLEAVYGQVYQRLVRLGAKPQLKLKFRGR